MTRITYSLQRKPTLVVGPQLPTTGDRVIPRETRKNITQIAWLIKEGQFAAAADKAHEHGELLGTQAWDHARGVEFHSKALQAARSGHDTARQARAHRALAASYGELGDYDRAMSHMTSFIQLANAAAAAGQSLAVPGAPGAAHARPLGEDPIELAVAYTQLGQLLLDAGRERNDPAFIDKAVAHLKKALCLFRDDPELVARSTAAFPADARLGTQFEARLLLGVAQCFGCEPAKGARNLETALALAGRTGNPEHLKLAHAYQAIVAEQQHDYASCIAHAQCVLKICEQRGDDFLEKARILADLGHYYERVHRYASALDAYERHAQLCEAFGTPEGIDAAAERVRRARELLEGQREIDRLGGAISAHPPSAQALVLYRDRASQLDMVGQHSAAASDWRAAARLADELERPASEQAADSLREIDALHLARMPGECLSTARGLLSSALRARLTPAEVARVELRIAQSLAETGASRDRAEPLLGAALERLAQVRSAAGESPEDDALVRLQLDGLWTLCELFRRHRDYARHRECLEDISLIEREAAGSARDVVELSGSESPSSSPPRVVAVEAPAGDRRSVLQQLVERRGNSRRPRSRTRAVSVSSVSSAGSDKADSVGSPRPLINAPPVAISGLTNVPRGDVEQGQAPDRRSAARKDFIQQMLSRRRDSGRSRENSDDSDEEPPRTRAASAAKPTEKKRARQEASDDEDCPERLSQLLDAASSHQTTRKRPRRRSQTPELRVSPESTNVPQISRPAAARPARPPFRVRVAFQLETSSAPETMIVPCPEDGRPWTVERVAAAAASKLAAANRLSAPPQVAKLQTACGDTLCPTDAIWDVVGDQERLVAVCLSRP